MSAAASWMHIAWMEQEALVATQPPSAKLSPFFLKAGSCWMQHSGPPLFGVVPCNCCCLFWWQRMTCWLCFMYLRHFSRYKATGAIAMSVISVKQRRFDGDNWRELMEKVRLLYAQSKNVWCMLTTAKHRRDRWILRKNWTECDRKKRKSARVYRLPATNTLVW